MSKRNIKTKQEEGQEKIKNLLSIDEAKTEIINEIVSKVEEIVSEESALDEDLTES